MASNSGACGLWPCGLWLVACGLCVDRKVIHHRTKWTRSRTIIHRTAKLDSGHESLKVKLTVLLQDPTLTRLFAKDLGGPSDFTPLIFGHLLGRLLPNKDTKLYLNHQIHLP